MVALNSCACRRGGVCGHACIGKSGCDECLVRSIGSQNDVFLAKQLRTVLWRFSPFAEQDEW